MEKNDLENLQKDLLDILFIIDKFCKKNNIEYSLAYGSMIGAVRHKGIIPWDDDLDLFMTRKNYMKFIYLWKKENIDGYYLQLEGPDTDSKINHTKVRKNGTILASKIEYEQNSSHMGIWVDIFPLDKMPLDKLNRKIYSIMAMIRIVLTRKECTKKYGFLVFMILKLIYNIPLLLQKKILWYTNKYIIRTINMNNNFAWVDLSCPETINILYKKNITKKYKYIRFEGLKTQMFYNYDYILKKYYGNYRKLPKVKDRVCKHNPEILVTSNSK